MIEQLLISQMSAFFYEEYDSISNGKNHRSLSYFYGKVFEKMVICPGI